jgi:hypothetical protein
MNRLRTMPPWQIILMALAVLAIVAVGAYFAVTKLTTSETQVQPTSTVPTDLNSKANEEILKRLNRFTPPRDLPQTGGRLQTPNPDRPQFPNPFGS